MKYGVRRIGRGCVVFAVALVAGAAPALAADDAPPGPARVSVTVEISERAPAGLGTVVVVGDGRYVVGEVLVVVGGGLVPSADYEVWLHSDPVLLGEVHTDADGGFEFTDAVPAGPEIGRHTVVARAVDDGRETASEPFLVVASEGAGGGPGVVDPNGLGVAQGGPNGQSASARGPLASTGPAVLGAMAVAAVGLATGGTLLARRNRRASRAAGREGVG